MKSKDEELAAIVCDALSLAFRGELAVANLFKKQANINQAAGFDESQRSAS